MSPAASLSSIAGDHIGVDMVIKTKDEYCNLSERAVIGCCRREEMMRRKQQQQKEYPPPIPLPWVLKRYYTPDGRLILREEKVRHHEYLQAHRSDGRLTLDLVPMDHNVTFMIPNNNTNADDDDDNTAAADGVVEMMKKDGSAGKCLGYSFNINSSSSSSSTAIAKSSGCVYGIGSVPISQIRPVHG